MHFCSGYRLEHVRRLTTKQFSLLIKETYIFENQQLLQFVNSVRISVHGKKADYERFIKPIQEAMEEAEEVPEALSKAEMQDLGFDVGG